MSPSSSQRQQERQQLLAKDIYLGTDSTSQGVRVEAARLGSGDDTAASGQSTRRRNTKWMTFVSIYSMMYFPLGVGPAFAYTGWIPGLLMLAYAALASYYSGRHLSELCTKRRKDGHEEEMVETYPKLAKYAFGSRGEFFITAVQTALYFLCGVFNIAYMPANFEQIFNTGSDSADSMKHEHYLTYYLITWGFMCVGSLLPSYHDTFYIALFSAVVSTVNALLQVLVIFFYQQDSMASAKREWVGGNWVQVLSALPAISYTFGGHGVFPEEVREMQDFSQFPQTINWLYLCSLPWYFLCSISSYYAYGKDIEGNPILNWPQNLWMTKVAAVFSLVGALVISITSNQVTLIALEENIMNLDSFQPLLGLYKKSTRASTTRSNLQVWPLRILVRLCFVTCQLGVALASRKAPLQFIQGFMGSLGVGCLTFWFPFAIYLKLRKEEEEGEGEEGEGEGGGSIRSLKRVWHKESINQTLLALGMLTSVIGMVYSGREVVTNSL